MKPRINTFPKISQEELTKEKLIDIADKAIEQNKAVFDALARI